MHELLRGHLIPQPATLKRALRPIVPFALRVAWARGPASFMARRRPTLVRDTVGSSFPVEHCQRSTPLVRPDSGYDTRVQAGKERNVTRAASLLDGIVLQPGDELSWHREVGPPFRRNGFVPGPELHDGRLRLGGGGGACQVANLLYWLAVHGGLTIVERHRHALDLFRDHERTAPFGCGATVFFPRLDLRLRNPHPYGLRLSCVVRDGVLTGVLFGEQPPATRYELVERYHRFVRRSDGVYRENALLRRWTEDGVAQEELLGEHSARVLYTVPEEEIA